MANKTEPIYQCFVEYMGQEGGTASVQWQEQGKLRSMLSVTRMMGYYQAMGRIVMVATIQRGTGKSIDVQEVLRGS